MFHCNHFMQIKWKMKRKKETNTDNNFCSNFLKESQLCVNPFLKIRIAKFFFKTSKKSSHKLRVTRISFFALWFQHKDKGRKKEGSNDTNWFTKVNEKI